MTRYLLAALLTLCLTSHAWAFPDNGVLETFTGADTTSPPNANWTNGVIGAATGLILIRTNAATSSNGDAYWNATSFNANQEAYAKIVSLTPTFGTVYLRLKEIGANTSDGYDVSWSDGTNVIQFFRMTNGSEVQLGSDISQTISVGDQFGATAIGDQICAWYKVGAGAWTNVGCRTDSTYPAGGYIGIAVDGSTAGPELDDFGGGNVTSVGGRHRQPIVLE